MNQVENTREARWTLAVKGLALMATLATCSVKTTGLAGTRPDDGGEASGSGGASPAGTGGTGGMKGSGGVPGSGGGMGKGGAGPSGAGGGTGGSPTGAGGVTGSGGMGMGGSSPGAGGAVVRLDGGPPRDMGPTVDSGRQDGPRVDMASVDSMIPASSVGVVQCGPAGGCSLGSTVCCAGAVAMCRPRAAGCGGSLTRQCDGPEDCDRSRICCGRAENHQGVFSTSCEEDKECRSGIEAELCHGNADCTNGQKCCPIPFANTTVGACRANCP